VGEVDLGHSKKAFSHSKGLPTGNVAETQKKVSIKAIFN
jgi:hypothetical protein